MIPRDPSLSESVIFFIECSNNFRRYAVFLISFKRGSSCFLSKLLEYLLVFCFSTLPALFTPLPLLFHFIFKSAGINLKILFFYHLHSHLKGKSKGIIQQKGVLTGYCIISTFSQ